MNYLKLPAHDSTVAIAREQAFGFLQFLHAWFESELPLQEFCRTNHGRGRFCYSYSEACFLLEIYSAGQAAILAVIERNPNLKGL